MRFDRECKLPVCFLTCFRISVSVAIFVSGCGNTESVEVKVKRRLEGNLERIERYSSEESPALGWVKAVGSGRPETIRGRVDAVLKDLKPVARKLGLEVESTHAGEELVGSIPPLFAELLTFLRATHLETIDLFHVPPPSDVETISRLSAGIVAYLSGTSVEALPCFGPDVSRALASKGLVMPESIRPVAVYSSDSGESVSIQFRCDRKSSKKTAVLVEALNRDHGIVVKEADAGFIHCRVKLPYKTKTEAIRQLRLTYLYDAKSTHWFLAQVKSLPDSGMLTRVRGMPVGEAREIYKDFESDAVEFTAADLAAVAISNDRDD